MVSISSMIENQNNYLFPIAGDNETEVEINVPWTKVPSQEKQQANEGQVPEMTVSEQFNTKRALGRATLNRPNRQLDRIEVRQGTGGKKTRRESKEGETTDTTQETNRSVSLS